MWDWIIIGLMVFAFIWATFEWYIEQYNRKQMRKATDKNNYFKTRNNEN